MKKQILKAAALLFCFLLPGCGGKPVDGPNQPQAGSAVYYDIIQESKPLYNVTGSKYLHCLGTQYYKGEPIQLWSDSPGRTSEIYVYKADGSNELLFEGLDRNFYLSASGYLDSEGNLYSWCLQGSFSKTSPSGEQLFNITLSDLELTDITDMCQLSDGRVFVLCNGNAAGGGALGELDPDTGKVSFIKKGGSNSYLGASKDELFCADRFGLWKVDTEDGHMEEHLSFSGTTYVLSKSGIDYASVQDFQVTGDQEIQLLRADYHGGQWALETLRREEISNGKVRLVMRGSFVNDTWIKEQVTAFNQSNSSYYVVMEDSDSYVDGAEFARLSSVEIAAGKGPDLFYGDVLGKYLYGIIQKGGLEDLAPYIKKSGIKEKDYFPATFSKWRDGKKIYGICVKLRGLSYVMDAAVLGTDKEPDIETLVEALLAYEGQDIYMQGWDSQKVLRMLFGGSENLWGMINWKKGTCDFSGSLFAGILNTAKRYGDDGRKLSSGLLDRNFYSTSSYKAPDMLKKKGLVEVGVLFDNGVYGEAIIGGSLAINANSANKQGSWEFIQFLLGEKAQSEVNSFNTSSVNMRISKTYLEEELAANQIYETETTFKLTEARIKYLMKAREDMRFFPMRTEPILDIICDEAADYFNGTKSIDQIIPIIQNRVKLYLEETGS